MKTTLITSSARALALAALLAGPMLASPANAQGLVPTGTITLAATQNTWATNMNDRSGVLIGLSRVAARIRFEDGVKRTFSISHAAYDLLRSSIGNRISFNVRHGVLLPS